MLSGIILAAGASSRLGSPKALVRVGAEPAVSRLVRALKDGGCRKVVVVLGAHADQIEDILPRAARPVRNENWTRGRSSSIKAGVAALPSTASFCIWPVDHPAVRVETVRALLEGPGLIRVPVHEGRRGHPIWFAAELRDELLALGDDQPLHELVHRDPARVVEVPVNDPMIHFNVDSPADLVRLGPGGT